LAAIQATPNLKNDFEQCVDYLSTFVTQNAKNSRSVANLQIGSGGGRGLGRVNCDCGCGKGRGNPKTAKDIHYTAEEYRKVTQEQKKELHQIRFDKKRKAPDPNLLTRSNVDVTSILDQISYIQNML